jgi:hypothetical protein
MSSCDNRIGAHKIGASMLQQNKNKKKNEEGRGEVLVLTSNTTFSFAFGLVRGFAWNVLLTTESECERVEITLPPSFPGIEKIDVKTLLIS